MASRLSAVCDVWQARILQPSDGYELQAGYERDQLDEFVNADQSQVDLNQDFSYRSTVMTVEAKVLFLVVHAAFEFFQVPSLSQPETCIALDELE